MRAWRRAPAVKVHSNCALTAGAPPIPTLHSVKLQNGQQYTSKRDCGQRWHSLWAVLSRTSATGNYRAVFREKSIMKNYKANPETRQSPVARKKLYEQENNTSVEDDRKQISGEKHAQQTEEPSLDELLQRYEVDGHREPATIGEALDEVEQRGELRDEMIQAIGETPEWKAYDQEVDFETNVVKNRYYAAEEKMTPARRAQMSAHVKQVHEAVMEKHANEIAENFVESLSSKEKDKLRDQFNRIDAKGVSLKYERPQSPVSMEESVKMFSEAMNEVNDNIHRVNKGESPRSPAGQASKNEDADSKDEDDKETEEPDSSRQSNTGVRTHGMNQRVQQARSAAAAMHEAKKGWNKKTKGNKKT
eukprot:gb/GECG01013476.1/.p1 GENE.gb/GECG01013476.1/~~gb/GECG01013476.1/.p1  ORF type:complete len:362 (+),score=67.50 gb/GECG01013476.1/:1-1086(+)